MTLHRQRTAICLVTLFALARLGVAESLAAQSTAKSPAAVATPKLGAPLPVDPEVTVGTLPNG
ncbi:MAG TPA: hypothetical protein VKP02_11005, partial [Gemmatimonadaceae bacterium]|nr:hypothetical protein [Gemmatimonadaceae bacterium]